jgi:hypothetical protein
LKHRTSETAADYSELANNSAVALRRAGVLLLSVQNKSIDLGTG